MWANAEEKMDDRECKIGQINKNLEFLKTKLDVLSHKQEFNRASLFSRVIRDVQ